MHPHIHCTLSFMLRVARAFTLETPLGCRGSACVEVMIVGHILCIDQICQLISTLAKD